MEIGGRIVLLVFWLYIIFTCALLLFSKGFLLKRIVINNTSVCQSDHWLVNNIWNGVQSDIHIQSHENGKDKNSCQMQLKPKFKKAILVIIDGLRHDFLTYSPNLDLTKVLPFQNKMVKLHNLMREEPKNGMLFRFEADPPTTTMQRIKGITTGSLPTFVDAGTNFNSYEITEDNILSQAIKQEKNISFMGCSTWTELFPTHFHRKIPFSALNVKDLDTIDYGIMKNLVPEMKRSDWSLLIAHFLGVDHCGHRYGTHHPEMTRKLTEMDHVIKDLTDNMDDETILFVMGDHGMTRSGDHGGDSRDEVMAGLFTYSKKGLFTPNENPSELPLVSQIDMVPTLSLLLDQPIPFSNLGSIIPHFFQGSSHNFLPSYLTDVIKNERKVKLASKLFQQINAAYVSYLNGRQLLGFIDEYQSTAKDLPATKIQIARSTFEFLDEKFEEYLREVLPIDFMNEEHLQKQIKEVEESIQELQNIHESLQEVLTAIKSTCRSVWAKFDVISMTMGISLMAFLATFVITSSFMMNVHLLNDAGKFFGFISTLGFAFCAVAMYFSVIGTDDTDKDSMVVFLALSFSFSLWLLSVNTIPTFGFVISVLQGLLNRRTLNKRWFIFTTCFLLQCGSLLANSYIIHEDTSVLFLTQSLVLSFAVTFVLEAIHNARNTELRGPGRTKTFLLLKTRLLKSLTCKHNLIVYGQIIVVMVCLRVTKFFWFCREMQLKCSISSYALPLVSLLSEFTAGHVHERLFVALFSLVAIVTITNFYLRKQGNLNGRTVGALSVKYVSSVMVFLILLHWCLQLMLTHKISKLFDITSVQQVYLPRIVYVLFLICLFAIIKNPLPVYIHKLADARQDRDTHANNINHIYNEIRRQLDNEQNTGDQTQVEKKVVAYGLRTVYSSAIVVFLFMLLVVTSMIMMDGMALPLFCLWLSGFVLSNLFAVTRRDNSMSDILISTIMWAMFASLGFYGTGHQNTIPSVRYPAAYIGFRGSIPEIVPQAVVILLNTFASQLICALALPLLMIFKKKVAISLDPDRQKEIKDDNEIDITENQVQSYFDLFKIAVAYLGLIMIRVSFAAGAAAYHRRHLMVWKIFAPRFMFEAAGYFLSTPLLIAGLLFFKRIDNAVANWFEKIQKLKMQ